MHRQLEPIYPSFSLALTEANDASELPPYESLRDGGLRSSSAVSRARRRVYEPPLMTTVGFRYNDRYYIPTLSWSDLWELDYDASNLQAALDINYPARDLGRLRRRRLTDLIVELALLVRRKRSVPSLPLTQKTLVRKISHLDLAS